MDSCGSYFHRCKEIQKNRYRACLRTCGQRLDMQSDTEKSFCERKTFQHKRNRNASYQCAPRLFVSVGTHFCLVCSGSSLIANAVLSGEKIIGAVIVILDVTESAKREQLRREFTSNVSHELKTPLTSISGFAEIMKSGGTSEETVMDFSKSIYDEAQRLISLVSDIIKISELDEGYVQFEKEQVDLYELSEEIAERLKPEAEKKKVRISVLGEKAEIFGVRKILDEMIYNLCDNAIKYNKENGLADIIITSAEGKVQLTVRDTGIGIPKAHRDRVFERFYRVDKSHSKAIGGTGLGLSIVKHGAAYHNAEISLESEEDKGTTVSIKFDI